MLVSMSMQRTLCGAQFFEAHTDTDTHTHTSAHTHYAHTENKKKIRGT